METHPTLQQQLTALSERYGNLGSRLSEAAKQLQESGIPLKHSLIDELTTYYQDFTNLQQQLIHQGEVAASQAVSFPQLEVLVKNIAKSEETSTVQQNALTVLEKVLKLKHKEQPQFSPLESALEKARQLQQLIPQGEKNPEIKSQLEALATGEHSLCALVALVERQNSLDDEEWAILDEKVTQAFNKTLAIAISRGKITLESVHSSVATPATNSPAIPKIPANADIVILEEPLPSAAPEVIIIPSVDVSQKQPRIDTQNIVFGNAPLGSQSTASAPLTLPTVGLKILVHLQGLGDRIFSGNEYAGTRGQGRRLEAFQIKIDPPIPGLNLRYMGHVSGIGDTPLIPEGQLVGERGKARQVEGFAIELTGPQASNYNIFYTAHIQNKGDVPICSNGQFCGTRGQGLRVEGMKVWVQAK